MTTIHFASIRDDIRCRKKIIGDTNWRTDDLAPRYGIYSRARPALARWEWRSVKLHTEDDRTYRLLFEVAPALAKWKAMLIALPAHDKPVAIARFEDQPGNAGGGLHIHANCEQSCDLVGADSVNMLYTLPDHGQLRRRRGAWTKALFCRAAGQFFRVDTLIGQEEFDL